MPSTASAGAACSTNASTTPTPTNLFKEALQRDPKSAQAYLGLALVSADGFDNAAIDWDEKALALDSNLVEAHELMANLALEDSDTAVTLKEADAAISSSPIPQRRWTRWRSTQP